MANNPSTQTALTPNLTSNAIPGQIIVKFKPNVFTLRSFTRQSVGATLLNTDNDPNLQLWDVSTLGNTAAIARLQNNGAIEYVEPNHRISLTSLPTDPSYSKLWGMNNTGQTGGTVNADINAPEALNFATGAGVTVGVVDTGVDYNHPDLNDNMWTNPGEIPNDGIDNDNNGYVDDYYGYDFINNDSDPFDDHSHGTHVAGTIAAEANNGIGVAGVAPQAKIMALKILDRSGRGDSFSAARAMRYATQMGVPITNHSWGNAPFSQTLRDAIAAAGAANQLFIAAAGNNGSNNDVRSFYPANYDLDNIISVAATTHKDQRAGFSNYGARTVDLGAPGDKILSTVPGGGYRNDSGTSMAAPHVAGVAALILSQSPNSSAQEIKDKLLQSAQPIDALKGITVTGGRLDALKAVFSGPPIKPPTTTNQLWTQQGFPNGVNETSDFFGRNLASGDFNGDGRFDLVIGAPQQNLPPLSATGKSNVMYGSESGLNQQGSQLWIQTSASFNRGLVGTRAEAGDRFGANQAAGDFNGDGFDDVVIGSPGEGVGTIAEAGIFHAIYGSAKGLTSVGNRFFDQSAHPDGQVEAGDHFAARLVAGDFDGDGFDDVAIGIPDEDIGTASNAGQVMVLKGSQQGLVKTGSQLWNQNRRLRRTEAEQGDRFGSSLTTGDFDGDGYDDLVVGAPREDIGSARDAGELNVIYGSRRGLRRSGSNRWDQADFNGSVIETDDRFAKTVAAGDFDGDGYDDLAIGAPGQDFGTKRDGGQVNVLYGTRRRGLRKDRNQSWTQDDVQGGAIETGDIFGAALAVGDFNGDGFEDLAVGSPHEEVAGKSEAGSVSIVYGSATGLVTTGSQTWTQNSPGIQGLAEAFDEFGASLTAQDFNNDGFVDLAIGVPGQTLGAAKNSGAVAVLYGSTQGLVV